METSDENRAAIQPKSLAFQASVLPLHHIGSLMSPPCLPVCAVLVTEISATFIIRMGPGSINGHIRLDTDL